MTERARERKNPKKFRDRDKEMRHRERKEGDGEGREAERAGLVALVPELKLCPPEGHRRGWSWGHHHGNGTLLPSPLRDRWRDPGKVTWRSGQSWDSQARSRGGRGAEEGLVCVGEGGAVLPCAPHYTGPDGSREAVLLCE